MGNNALRTRQGDVLICSKCKKAKAAADFGDSRPYADGSPRKKPYCKACDAADKRSKAQRANEERIMTVEAPIKAAELLFRQHPEALADLVRRYHYLYAPLLESERKRMLKPRTRPKPAEKAIEVVKVKKAQTAKKVQAKTRVRQRKKAS